MYGALTSIMEDINLYRSIDFVLAVSLSYLAVMTPNASLTYGSFNERLTIAAHPSWLPVFDHDKK